jgi:hypothetical protein
MTQDERLREIALLENKIEDASSLVRKAKSINCEAIAERTEALLINEYHSKLAEYSGVYNTYKGEQ